MSWAARITTAPSGALRLQFPEPLRLLDMDRNTARQLGRLLLEAALSGGDSSSELRAHALACECERLLNGDRSRLLFLAEGTIVTLAVEHFVRLILGREAKDCETLGPLLKKATAGPQPLLVLPWDNAEDGRQKLCNVRNTLMHGNFAQAARQVDSSVEDYLSTEYLGELDMTFRVLDNLVCQFDPRTGLRLTADAVMTETDVP